MRALTKFLICLALAAVAVGGLVAYVRARVLGGSTFSEVAKKNGQQSKASLDTVGIVDNAGEPIGRAYVEAREPVVRHSAPTRAQVQTFVVAADRARASDSLRIAKRDTAIAKLVTERDHLIKRPGPARFTAFAEGLWDVGNKVPVIRVGADFRVFKNLSLTAAIDAAPRERSIETRALVGARWTFR